MSEARTSKCVIVLLPEVILVLVIVDILELSSKKDRWPVEGTDWLEQIETSEDSVLIWFLFLWSYFLSFVMEMRNAKQPEYSDVSWATRVMEFTVHKLSFV